MNAMNESKELFRDISHLILQIPIPNSKNSEQTKEITI
jgi:hypothetical protein